MMKSINRSLPSLVFFITFILTLSCGKPKTTGGEGVESQRTPATQSETKNNRSNDTSGVENEMESKTKNKKESPEQAEATFFVKGMVIKDDKV